MTAQDQILSTLIRIEGKLDLIVGEHPEQGGRLVDADWIAKHYGVRREWVYRNKGWLGAKPFGSGVRPRLLFDTAEVDRLIRGKGKLAPAHHELDIAVDPVPKRRSCCRSEEEDPSSEPRYHLYPPLRDVWLALLEPSGIRSSPHSQRGGPGVLGAG